MSRRSQVSEPMQGQVLDLAHDGRGILKPEGKAVFVPDVLTGETIEFRLRKKRRSHDEGELLRVISPSPDRVDPRCAHFGLCGGCSLQHLRPDAQLVAKQKQLSETLQRIGGVSPEQWLEPLAGPQWGYRRKARLGVKWVHGKQRVLVGFRERSHPYVADISGCEVLDSRVGQRLTGLAELIQGLSCRERLPQIEVAVGDEAVALVFRHLDPLTLTDRQAIIGYCREADIWPYFQPGGLDSVQAGLADTPALSYELPEFDVRIQFEPIDFIQVNAGLNRAMVSQALDLLEPGVDDVVLELFAGLGNFTLPMARRGASVHAVEGDAGLVERGRNNAQRNGLSADYHVADLFESQAGAAWLDSGFRKVLLDPPRAGADLILPEILARAPQRIVYVSCHPATLARDARLIVEAGYRMDRAGVMDMFPHTGHVESIARFERA